MIGAKFYYGEEDDMMWDSAISGGRTSLPKVLHLGTMCTFLTTNVLIIAQTMCVCFIPTTLQVQLSQKSPI